MAARGTPARSRQARASRERSRPPARSSITARFILAWSGRSTFSKTPLSSSRHNGQWVRVGGSAVLVLGLDPNFPAQPEICFRRNPCAQKKGRPEGRPSTFTERCRLCAASLKGPASSRSGDSPEDCVPAAWTSLRLAAFSYGAGASCAAVSAFGGGVGDIPLSRNFWARLPGATSAT